jgi:ABC-type Fe3+/spermidine/putrescine transport system ATPase subunit
VNMTKRFGKVTALDQVNLSVYPGEFLTLLGPSGCGKTTLLRIVAGFETPTEGRVFVSGKDVTDVPPERRPLNMVFQRYALFPHLDVCGNIAFGMRLRHTPEAEIRERGRDALVLVGLEGMQERMPHQLSGGQAQRVALARALVNEPEVLLLDEPLSALDRKIRQHMRGELRRIQEELGTTFVYVTHDQEEAMSMSTKIALMEHGCVRQLACPSELYFCPSSEFAADFVGDANMLRACVIESPAGPAVEFSGFTLTGVSLAEWAAGDRVRLVVRPEAVKIVNPPAHPEGVSADTVWGTIVRSAFYGFYWMHWVAVGEDAQEMAIRELCEAPAAQPGEKVWLSIDTGRAVVLAIEDAGERA